MRLEGLTPARSSPGDPNYTWWGRRVASANGLPLVNLNLAGLSEHLLRAFPSDTGLTLDTALVRGAVPPPEKAAVDLESSDEELAAQLWQRVRTAVERCAVGARRLAVSLGGIDSAGVLAAACEVRSAADVIAYTFDFDAGADVSYAREMCSAFGVEHRVVRVDDAPEDLSPALVVDGLPYLTFTAVHELHCMGEVIRGGADVLLTGGYGDDVLSGNAHEVATWVARDPTAALAFLKRLKTPYAESFLRRVRQTLLGPLARRAMPRALHLGRVKRGFAKRAPWLSESVLRAGLAGIEATGSGYLPPLAEHEWRSELVRRTRRAIGLRMQTVQQTGLARGDPMLDNDLVAFASAVPFQRMNLGGIDRGLFRRALPARVPSRVRERIAKAGAYADLARLGRQRAPTIERLTNVEELARLGLVDPVLFRRGLRERGIHDVVIWPILSAEAFLRSRLS